MVMFILPLLIPAAKFISGLNSSNQLLTYFSRPLPAVCTTEVGKLDQTPIRINKLHEHSVQARPSGNYDQHSIWDSTYFQSLNNPYEGEINVKRSAQLKETVKDFLKEEDEMKSLELLELIDDLQSLGLSYHFETQIKQALTSIYNKLNTILQLKQDDLYAKALIFRLFRQHGFNVVADIFDTFKDEKGNFKTSLSEDTKGMLFLYEASYFLVEGESTLEMAREFTAKHLKKSLDENKIDHNLAVLVHHTLELPLHWRTTRLEESWFIDIYEKRANMNPLLLELAKLDFHIVQAKYQELNV